LLLRLEGYSGFELQTSLEAQGIYSELADPFQVVFVLPLLKAKLDYPFEEIGKRIQSAVAGIGDSYRSDGITESLLFNEDISCPALSFAEVAQMESEWLSFEESVGRVMAGSIIPYPPGIPLLISGEMVTGGHIRYLDELLRMGAKLQGAIRVKEKQLVVVKEGMEE
jgi:arginine decarboxylase